RNRTRINDKYIFWWNARTVAAAACIICLLTQHAPYGAKTNGYAVFLSCVACHRSVPFASQNAYCLYRSTGAIIVAQTTNKKETKEFPLFRMQRTHAPRRAKHWVSSGFLHPLANRLSYARIKHCAHFTD
ncbi:MAG: hypothetical protein RR867_09235, partial [Ruthenibacterium sp.]